MEYLNIRMKSDKTDPQHRSISSIITTTGESWLSCSLYHDAKMDMSAACFKEASQTQMKLKATSTEILTFIYA